MARTTRAAPASGRQEPGPAPASPGGATWTLRTPTPLVLGALTGLVAMATITAMTLPLSWALQRGQITELQQRVAQSATSAGIDLPEDRRVDAAELGRLDVTSLAVFLADGTERYQGVPLPSGARGTCNAVASAWLVDESGNNWAIGCFHLDDQTTVVAGRMFRLTWSWPITVSTVVFAAMTGIVTALGVVRVLQPLTMVARALREVEAGKRGVHVEPTGFLELDEIIERVNATARAMDDREEAAQARIQVVHELARIVAHEIRNPLQSLELLTSLIVAEEDSGERIQIGHSIHAEIRNLDQVVHRLLREGIAKGNLRLDMARKPIAPLIEQVIHVRGPQAAARGIQLLRGNISHRPIPADTALLGRAVDNLVLNALQAVDDNTGLVMVAVVEDAEWLSIRVEDNGPGVDPTLGDAIFDSNVTTKPTGSGIGLALVRGVFEAHGGYIDHDRSPLGGARFVARLPLAWETTGGDDGA